jgi:hypothetical protein
MRPVDYVNLEYSEPQGQVALREISGREEWLVSGSHTFVVIQLLDQLLVDVPGTMWGQGTAARLTAADRDRLLVTIYLRCYGQWVISTITCRSCGDLFDLNFNLLELEKSIKSNGSGPAFDRQGDQYVLPDGSRFRLPTGEDEIAISQYEQDQALEELMRRCFSDQKKKVTQEDLKVIETAAPLIDLELAAGCPYCGKDQIIHFNLQYYLLTALQAEQTRLAGEIHLLAITYGWGLNEILSLTRSQRRMYVRLIEDQLSQQRMRLE